MSRVEPEVSLTSNDRSSARLFGAALALAGLLQTVGTVLHPNDTAATPYLFEPRWPVAHVILALSFLLAVFGLMGLFGLVADKVGPIGIVGWFLAAAGCVLLVGVTLTEAFLLPVIAANRPPQPLAQWLDPSGPLAGAVVVSLVTLLCFVTGFVTLGVSVERYGLLPRYSGLLVAVVAVLNNGEFLGPIGFDVYVGSGVALGLGWLWWGSARLRSVRNKV